MSKTISYFISSLLILLLCSNGCNNDTKSKSNASDNKTIKLNSKEAIYNHFLVLYPDISENDLCIDNPESFDDLFIIGFFAHDRGCGDNVFFYKGDSIALNENTIQQILMDNGFKSNPSLVVEKYHLEVVNINKSSLTSIPDKFDTLNYEFFPPKTYIEDNMIYSSIWVQRPSGMVPEVRFYLSNMVFDSNGKLISSSQTKSFSVDY